MIKKIVRILLIFAALVSVIAGAALLACRIAFSDARLQGIFLNSARWYLQRGVSLQSLSLGIFSGLELKGLAISEKPDFTMGTFLSAGRVRVKMPLLPLLHHYVRISEVGVEDLRVHIAREKAGDFNFEDLKIAYGSPEKTGDMFRVAVPRFFQITDVRVTGGALQYTDASLRNLRVELTGIDVSARDVSLFKPFDARIAFVIAGTKTPVRARLTVDLPGDRIVITEGAAGTGKAVLRVSGVLEHVTGSEEMQLVLDAEGDPSVLNDFCGILPLETGLTLFPLPRIHAKISGTPRALSLRFK